MATLIRRLSKPTNATQVQEKYHLIGVEFYKSIALRYIVWVDSVVIIYRPSLYGYPVSPCNLQYAYSAQHVVPCAPEICIHCKASNVCTYTHILYSSIRVRSPSSFILKICLCVCVCVAVDIDTNRPLAACSEQAGSFRAAINSPGFQNSKICIYKQT